MCLLLEQTYHISRHEERRRNSPGPGLYTRILLGGHRL